MPGTVLFFTQGLALFVKLQVGLGLANQFIGAWALLQESDHLRLGRDGRLAVPGFGLGGGGYN